jgi:hypothetical protein
MHLSELAKSVAARSDSQAMAATIAKDRDAVAANLANSLRVSREIATAALHFLEILSVFRRKCALH